VKKRNSDSKTKNDLEELRKGSLRNRRTPKSENEKAP
jgi:hypothetical protein